MSNAEKRSVHTDALDSLGTIIGPNEQRDAIHLAVEPAVASEELVPGEDVGFQADGTMGPSLKPVGIVDPFLKESVLRGQHFWLVVYPRQITSLRHVWTHPAFDGAKDTEEVKTPWVANEFTIPLSNPRPWSIKQEQEAAHSKIDAKVYSRKWIENFANNLDQTYNRVMTAAANFLNNGDYTYDNEETYKDHWGKFGEFWGHYEVVTGESAKERDGDYFFSCSC